MKARDLIKSFMTQAKWGQLADDGRPYRGVKWLTQKQRLFLESLMRKEKLEFNYCFIIDDYRVEMGAVSPLNNCASIAFYNVNQN